jgi:hypothetical protein
MPKGSDLLVAAPENVGFALRALTRHLPQIVSTLSVPTIVRDASRRAAGACFAMLSQNVLSEEADKRWCYST